MAERPSSERHLWRPASHRFVLGLAPLVAGCGYQLAAQGPPLPGGPAAVEVPLAGNETAEPGVEGQLTDRVRHRLASLGLSRPDTQGEVDTLELTVASSSGGPLAPKVAPLAAPGNPPAGFNVSLAPGLYQVALEVRARLRRGDAQLWQDNLSRSERYLPADDLPTFEANRRQALRRLVDDLAREVCARLTAGP